jgi:hypothetical protein
MSLGQGVPTLTLVMGYRNSNSQSSIPSSGHYSPNPTFPNITNSLSLPSKEWIGRGCIVQEGAYHTRDVKSREHILVTSTADTTVGDELTLY